MLLSTSWTVDFRPVPLPHNTLKSTFVPLDRLLFCDPMTRTYLALRSPSLSNPLTGTGHATVEVHAINTNGWIVFDAQVDMFADTEAEIACLGEITRAEFVFFDFEATLKDFLSFGTADCDVDSDFLITANTLQRIKLAGSKKKGEKPIKRTKVRTV